MSEIGGWLTKGKKISDIIFEFSLRHSKGEGVGRNLWQAAVYPFKNMQNVIHGHKFFFF